MSIDKVREFVKRYDSALEPILYPHQTASVEEAARVVGVEPAQSALPITFEQLVGITNGVVIDAEAAE